MPDPQGNGPTWQPLAEDGGVPLILVRHGRTAWNRERRFLGRTDVPLDDQGHRQARAVGRVLAGVPLAAVICSPLQRASQTAAAVASHHGLALQTEPRLVELSQGELEGQPGKVLPERYPDFLTQWIADPASARVPGGETLGECQTRSVAALDAIVASAEPGRPIAVVSHQMVITSLLCHFLDLPLRMYRLLGHDNAAYSMLRAHRGRLAVHRVHQRGHLGPPFTSP